MCVGWNVWNCSNCCWWEANFLQVVLVDSKPLSRWQGLQQWEVLHCGIQPREVALFQISFAYWLLSMLWDFSALPELCSRAFIKSHPTTLISTYECMMGTTVDTGLSSSILATSISRDMVTTTHLPATTLAIPIAVRIKIINLWNFVLFLFAF